MSVTVLQDITYERFNGWREPQFPEGMWFGHAEASGDASGGPLLINLLLLPGTLATLSSKLFTVEAISYETNGSGVNVVRFNATGFIGQLGGERRNVLSTLTQSNGNVGNSIQGRDLAALPKWLGSQRAVGQAATFQAVSTNENGVDMIFEASGYWWGPRAVLANGGPQRPPGGLYRV